MLQSVCMQQNFRFQTVWTRSYCTRPWLGKCEESPWAGLPIPRRSLVHDGLASAALFARLCVQGQCPPNQCTSFCLLFFKKKTFLNIFFSPLSSLSRRNRGTVQPNLYTYVPITIVGAGNVAVEALRVIVWYCIYSIYL